MTEKQKSAFVEGVIRILNGSRLRIKEYSRSLFECYTMLEPIGRGFGRIPFDRHVVRLRGAFEVLI